MSLAPECLDNIIGLSQTTCVCFENKPYDAGTSKSGLYLDKLEGLDLKLVESVEDCEEGSVWDIMAGSVSESIKAVKGDLLRSLGSKYKKKRQPYSGTIGDTKFTRSFDLTNTYNGVRLYSANIMGGVMTIKRIGLLFDSTATFNVYVYDNVSDSPIQTYSVTANANQLTWFNLPAPLNLDMNAYSDEAPNYYVVYEKAAFKPKDTSFGCGCGSGSYKYYWSTKNPKFTNGEKFRWGEYIMPTGTEGANISERDTIWATQNKTYGLILDLEFKCKVSELICKDELDYDNNDFASGLAVAVRYKAGEFLIDKILASGNINYYTMTDRERLMGKKNTYVKNYTSILEWLAENINWKANDCLECDSFNDIIKTGILS